MKEVLLTASTIIEIQTNGLVASINPLQEKFPIFLFSIKLRGTVLNATLHLKTCGQEGKSPTQFNSKHTG